MPALLALLLLATPVQVRPAADAQRLVVELGAGRPLVLHFWATWCAACREEFPRLSSLLAALPGEGVAAAVVSVDEPAKREEVDRALAGYGLSRLPSILLEAADPDAIGKALGAPRFDGTLPATLVYDGRARLVRAFVGRTPLPALEKAIRRARAASAR